MPEILARTDEFIALSELFISVCSAPDYSEGMLRLLNESPTMRRNKICRCSKSTATWTMP